MLYSKLCRYVGLFVFTIMNFSYDEIMQIESKLKQRVRHFMRKSFDGFL
jgi:hypothetical protein